MALPTLITPTEPSVGATSEPKISLYENDFGDGYTQRAPKGLNHIREVLDLKFELLTAAQSATFRTFLQERGGYQPFMYTAPAATVPMRFVCKKWRRQFDDAGYQTITATFEQDFGLAT